MKQTFIITVQGHTLEFNRLLYPLRYCVSPQEFEVADLKIFVEKDEEGDWMINALEKMPRWVIDIASGIFKAIRENEHTV